MAANELSSCLDEPLATHTRSLTEPPEHYGSRRERKMQGPPHQADLKKSSGQRSVARAPGFCRKKRRDAEREGMLALVHASPPLE